MIVGLTGSFGTGKTLVASIFRSLGAAVIDADRIAHGVIEKGAPAYKRIIRKFGDGILNRSGNIDRRKLASAVFGRRDRVKELNRIVHPEVIAKIKERLKSIRDKRIVVIDAPLLIEANLAQIVDKVIVVKAAVKNQINRCTAKFSITRKECLARIENQMPLAEKAALADFIIDNNGTESETRRQVKEIWNEILKG